MAVIKNPHWEAYAVARVKGLSQRQAYKKAYPNFKGKDATADTKGYELEQKSEIRDRYNELKGEVADNAVLTRREKREMLANMARNEKLQVSDRQRAIDLDNKMEDEYTTRIEGTLGITKLEDLI